MLLQHLLVIQSLSFQINWYVDQRLFLVHVSLIYLFYDSYGVSFYFQTISMDPITRRHVWDIIDNAKKWYVIVLISHSIATLSLHSLLCPTHAFLLLGPYQLSKNKNKNHINYKANKIQKHALRRSLSLHTNSSKMIIFGLPINVVAIQRQRFYPSTITPDSHFYYLVPR